MSFSRLFILFITLSVTLSLRAQTDSLSAEMPELEEVYRSSLYRGRSQSYLIDAAERMKQIHYDFRAVSSDIGLDELQALVSDFDLRLDSVSMLMVSAMQVSLNADECTARLERADRAMVDIKEFMPLLYTNENVLDFRQKLMALSLGSGEASVDLFHASLITYDDLPPLEGVDNFGQEVLANGTGSGSGDGKGGNAVNDMAANASRTEVDEAAINLLKEAYQRDMDANASGGEGDYISSREEDKTWAAVEKVTQLQEGMEEDILRLMNALAPIDPLAEQEEDLSSDGDIVFDPDVSKELLYRIQIGYFKRNRNPDHFHGLHPVYAFTTEEGYAKFYTGQYRSYRSAVEIKNYIRDNFVPDAFVVPFMGAERISISDAIFTELEVVGN